MTESGAKKNEFSIVFPLLQRREKSKKEKKRKIGRDVNIFFVLFFNCRGFDKVFTKDAVRSGV